MSSIKARDAFREKLGKRELRGWSQLNDSDIYMIASCIARELDGHYYAGDCTLEVGKITIRKNASGFIDMADIKVNQKINGEDGWKDRQGVSFEIGGFIGFCGWADSHNQKPFINGFMKWLEGK